MGQNEEQIAIAAREGRRRAASLEAHDTDHALIKKEWKREYPRRIDFAPEVAGSPVLGRPRLSPLGHAVHQGAMPRFNFEGPFTLEASSHHDRFGRARLRLKQDEPAVCFDVAKEIVEDQGSLLSRIQLR